MKNLGDAIRHITKLEEKVSALTEVARRDQKLFEEQDRINQGLLSTIEKILNITDHLNPL